VGSGVTSVLVIGDPHATPSYDNERFRVLGKYIAETRPDVVVCMGDLGDMASLSSHSKNRNILEGRQVKADFASMQEANALLWAPTAELNEKAKANHKPRYSPQRYLCVGNHEDRIMRVAEETPALTDWLLEEFAEACQPWTVVPFKQPLIIERVVFRHFKPNAMGRAVSSRDNLARSILNQGHCSQVVGHCHLLDFATTTTDLGERIFAMSPGCFMHPNHDETWSRGTDGPWWRGVVHLHGLRAGFFEHKTEISLASLTATYG